MIKISFVIFRECLEISLLLGIILASTRTISNSRALVILGSLLGISGAGIVAFFTRSIVISLGGVADEIFDASVMLITALLISWTAVWMQGYNQKIRQNLSDISDAIETGKFSKFILVNVVAFSILREGIEIILFVYSIASAENISVSQYIWGLLIGAMSGFACGYILYIGLIKFAGKYIFKISTVLLILIAAGLSAQSAGLLSSIGIINLYTNELWNSSWLVENSSLVGKILNIIIGYDARPNGIQLIFYFGSILLTIAMIRLRTVMSLAKRKK